VGLIIAAAVYFARMMIKAIVSSAIAASSTLWPQRAIDPSMFNLRYGSVGGAVVVRGQLLMHLLWARSRGFQLQPLHRKFDHVAKSA
jgi:hypothetical protein